MPASLEDKIFKALDGFCIELPSWGFANTGTRFGKFQQAAAATSTEEKFTDAGQVHRFTGCCPTVAVHVLWDFPKGKSSVGRGRRRGRPARRADRLHQSQHLSGPDLQARLARQSRSRSPRARRCSTFWTASKSPRAVDSRDLSLWFADGSNYPGTANIRHRRQWFERRPARSAPAADADAADAGGVQAVRAGLLSHRHRRLGHGPARWRGTPDRRRRCWWIPGHHYQAQNIEQIVAWLLARRHARRLPLQRPPLCRRRSDAGLDRSLPGLPHLPRDRACSNGRPASAPTSPT